MNLGKNLIVDTIHRLMHRTCRLAPTGIVFKLIMALISHLLLVPIRKNTLHLHIRLHYSQIPELQQEAIYSEAAH